MDKVIFVNATAAQYGGAVTIIQQFIDTFIRLNVQGLHLYLFCTAEAIDNRNCSNITIVHFGKKGFYERLKWDYTGMKKWGKKNSLKPDAILSFQNTGVFYNKIPQVIYLHNAIPFDNHSWNFLKKEERSLWFYKHIYPIFIKLTLFPHSYIVVQNHWMKEKVAKKFNFPRQNITVALPSITIKSEQLIYPELDKDKYHFFYPASPVNFKNHEEIIKALDLWQKEGIQQNIMVHFTCLLDQLPKHAQQLISDLNVRQYIYFWGNLSFEHILGFYEKADCLIFPSKIETVGLPLLEAASFGMPIICAEKEYTREVLLGYKNVSYVPLEHPELWVEAMKNSMKNARRIPGYQPKQKEEWQNVFELLKEVMIKN